MAKGQLASNGWMTNTKIVDIVLGKTRYEYGGRSYDAKQGVIFYTLNNQPNVYPWQIRADSNQAELAKLEVGKRFRIYRKAITTGHQTGYDWAKVVPLEAKPASASTAPDTQLDPELFSAPESQPASARALRDDVADLVGIIADQELSVEMRALIELLCVEMIRDPNLFSGSGL